MRGRELALVVVGIVLVAVLLVSLGGGMMLGWGMTGPWMMGRYGYGFGPWMGIGMLLFWVAVVGGVALLAVGLLHGSSSTQAPVSRPDPLAILKERYARGEITRDDYERMRQDLTAT